MTVTAAALRELHRIHRQLADLQERMERGPRQVHSRAANVQLWESQLAEVKDRVKQTQVTVDRKQLDLKSSEQKIVDLKRKLNTCSSNREYQALLEQTAAAEMANSVLADEILEAMDKIDQLRAAVGEKERNVAAGRQDLEKTQREVAETAESLKADVARLGSELAGAESALPVDFRADYARVVQSKGADGLAVAEDGVCTGCGHQITINMLDKLMLSKPIFCKACGRLLYLPED
jgi:predicted  nucleic acid-binding Zn-ribbon protein